MEDDELRRLRMVLGRLGRVLRQQSSDGLTYPQISLLFAVERSQPVSAGDLAVLDGVSPPSVSRSLTELSAAGLVSREKDPSDRRSVRVRLTDAGVLECTRLRGSREAWLLEHLEALSATQVKALVRALPALERLVETPD